MSAPTIRRCIVALCLLIAPAWWSGAAHDAAAASNSRVDLRVLVLDDNSPWVDALAAQMTVEGVPFTAVPLLTPGRPTVNDAFLATADHAYFQAIVAPDANLSGLSAAEVTAVRAYEATFAVREVDGYNWPNASIGLQSPMWSGDPAGITATVTPVARAQGFQYLTGPLPIAAGSYAYLAQPVSPMPVDTTYTSFITAPIPGLNTMGSLVGVHTEAGVEQMVVTIAMNFNQAHFKYLAHGIVTWATRGVHLGLNRNRMTFHIDDAFASVALWDPTLNCTPGEDCAGAGTAARMTAADVAYAAQWQAAHQYTFTLAFNGFYADTTEPTTQALVANRSAFRWLNHGYEHVYQGCVQDFSTSPWRCTTGANGIVWVPAATISSEITNNIAVGNSLGLRFDSHEYLSGEHSGLTQLPQQPVDNRNFALALTTNRITTIGADASRESAPRTVGGATTVPRHPTILYYNAATIAQEVDEYNWLYTTRANGGGGYCEDNPATATCVAPVDEAAFLDTIVPNDAAYDMSFILSNDPRPFYAHTSNMAGDRILYPLVGSILDSYRSTFSATAPLLNLTLGEASQELRRQSAWAVAGMSALPTVTAFVQNGVVTVSNRGGVRVPFTAPAGTTVAGTTLESYGGEVSGWLAEAGTTTALLPGATLAAPTFTSPAALTVTARQSFTFVVSTTGTPLPTIARSGSLSDGVTFVDRRDGTGVLSGTPSNSSVGTRQLTFIATNAVGAARQSFTLIVQRPPTITSASTWSTRVGSTSSFTIRATGYPTPTLSATGTPPRGMTLVVGTDGTIRLTGVPTTVGTYQLNVVATNAAGSATQTLSVRVLNRG